MKIELLDCTLRDGGYHNDWNFGHNTLINVAERVVSAGVDFMELGFLDQRRPFDINRSIIPDTECMRKIYGKVDSKQTKFVGMIDYGTCDISNIQPCSESFLDGIRVIFKKTPQGTSHATLQTAEGSRLYRVFPTRFHNELHR